MYSNEMNLSEINDYIDDMFAFVKMANKNRFNLKVAEKYKVNRPNRITPSAARARIAIMESEIQQIKAVLFEKVEEGSCCPCLCFFPNKISVHTISRKITKLEAAITQLKADLNSPLVYRERNYVSLSQQEGYEMTRLL